MLELALTEATGGIVELERPEEVARLLKVGPDGEDFMDQVLHAHDAVLAEMLFDDGVVGECNALLAVSLGVAALVDELADRLEIGVAVGDEGLDDLQHLHGGLGQSDEDAVVDLEEAQELESLALLWVDFVDTLDADGEGELWFGWDVVRALLLGNA